MTSENSPVDLLARALRQAEELIATVTPDQASLRTPCAEWDLRTLVNHVVRDTDQFTKMATGAKWESGEIALDPDQWLNAFASGSAGLLSAWREQGALDAASTNRISQQIAEFSVHGWDIARSNGYKGQLDAEVAAFGLQWAKHALKPEYRGTAFGPEVEIATDAPAPDQLAAFFGRRP
ncbi:MAG TPA: TIGR03086 family metal-binding protein [Candidatus Acidoferrales bacterium]|nr:TIGR03086 family metal-binding protein [Candidatus Acidoferrales bacterium]